MMLQALRIQKEPLFSFFISYSSKTQRRFRRCTSRARTLQYVCNIGTYAIAHCKNDRLGTT